MSEMPSQFDQILDTCLDGIVDQGWSVTYCLERYPAFRTELEPLLLAAAHLKESRQLVAAPAALRLAVEGPLAARLKPRRRSRLTPMRRAASWIPPAWRVAAAGLIAFVSLSAGVAYAADQSLPGSPLFELDRAIEQMRLKLSPNAATRVQLELNFAEERLQEADRLSQRGDTQHLQDALAIYTSLVSDAAREAASQPDPNLVAMVDHRLSGYRTQIEDLRIALPQGSQQALDEALRASEPGFAVTPVVPTGPSNDLVTTSPSDGSAGEPNQQERAAACDMGREQPRIADLAALYGTTYDTILARFCGGESLGSINEAYSISQTTGVSVDEIFAMEQSGMSWGAIKQTLDSRGQGQGNGGQGNGNSGQGQGNSNGGQGNGNGNAGQGNGNGNGNNDKGTPNPPGQSGDKDNNGKGNDK